MERKNTVSEWELMSYLEEMIQMNLADEIEETYYEDCKWNGFGDTYRKRKDDYLHIVKNYRTYQNEGF